MLACQCGTAAPFVGLLKVTEMQERPAQIGTSDRRIDV